MDSVPVGTLSKCASSGTDSSYCATLNKGSIGHATTGTQLGLQIVDIARVFTVWAHPRGVDVVLGGIIERGRPGAIDIVVV